MPTRLPKREEAFKKQENPDQDQEAKCAEACPPGKISEDPVHPAPVVPYDTGLTREGPVGPTLSIAVATSESSFARRFGHVQPGTSDPDTGRGTPQG